MAVRPPAPLPTQAVGSISRQVAMLADAVNRKADQTLEPTYSAVLLMAPGGATWRVSVSDAGVLSAVVVPR